MQDKNAKKTYIFMVIAAISIGVAYGEVEIYKAGKKYDPYAKTAPATESRASQPQTNAATQNLEIIRGQEPKYPNAEPKIDIKGLLEGAKQFLNKEQLEELEKTLETQNYELEKQDTSNFEKFMANYSNLFSQ